MILGEVVIAIMVSIVMAAVVYSAGYYTGTFCVQNKTALKHIDKKYETTNKE